MSINKVKNYLHLEEIYKKYVVLESVNDLLNWDSSVVMPSLGSNSRAIQISTIKNLSNSIIKSSKVSELLKRSEDERLDFWQLRNLQEMRRLHTDATIIDKKLHERLSLSIAECEVIWRDAKKENNFKKLQPYLNKVINLVQEVATVKASFYGTTKYDALVSQFDVGRTAVKIDALFNQVETYITQNIDRVIEKQEKESFNIAKLPFVPIGVQKKLIKEILKKIGFNFSKGRLDTSSHPFCRGISTDTRITTRYTKANFLYALMGAIHEAGHGMYIQNIAKDWENQPIGFYKNMTIHESQSLFYEYQIASSQQFIEYILPILQNYITDNISVESIYTIIKRVKKSDIRIEADEFTYPLHVIHRYKLEKALIEENLKAEDIPSLWDESFYKLFGKKPDSDSTGCLQDIHWSLGYFGYFPCYLLGAMFAAQLKYKVESSIPSLQYEYTDTNLNDVQKWLKFNIHNYGGLYSSDELITKSCGEELKSEYFKKYLIGKFDN